MLGSGLRAPGSAQNVFGLRAQVSKIIGLQAPQQKFQGSKAPGTPPLGPCLHKRLTHKGKMLTFKAETNALGKEWVVVLTSTKIASFSLVVEFLSQSS